MSLPDIPDEAVDALLHSFSPYPDEWSPADRIVNQKHVQAVWPYLYAAALEDFADRIDKTRELAGAGDDPFGFVAASARTLAHDARQETTR